MKIAKVKEYCHFNEIAHLGLVGSKNKSFLDF